MKFGDSKAIHECQIGMRIKDAYFDSANLTFEGRRDGDSVGLPVKTGCLVGLPVTGFCVGFLDGLLLGFPDV